MAALGVGCALAWLHSFAHSGQVCICQGLSQTPPPDKGCEVPAVLCCVCTHNTVCEHLVLLLPFESKGQRDLHDFKENLAYTSELLTRWVPFKPFRTS